MVFDISSLEPSIRAILSAPGTDLTTISAKRVRKQLLEVEPSLTQDFLKENKEAVDGVIASVFEAISAEMGGVEAASQTPEEESKPARKRKSRGEEDFEDVVDDGEEEEVGSVTPPPKKAKKGSKNGRELSDAELARQLSSEINGRSRRSGGRTRASNGSSPKKGSRKKKSAEVVDSDGDESDDDRKRAKPKKRAGGTAKGGFAKEYILRSV
jgi:upstream activation factor subunit UAF30